MGTKPWLIRTESISLCIGTKTKTKRRISLDRKRMRMVRVMRSEYTIDPGRVGTTYEIVSQRNDAKDSVSLEIQARNLADESVYLFFRCWFPSLIASSIIAIFNNGAKLGLVLLLLNLGAPVQVAADAQLGVLDTFFGFLANLSIIVVGYSFSVWANVSTVLICRALEEEKRCLSWNLLKKLFHPPLVLSTVRTEFQSALSKLKHTFRLIVPGVIRSIDLALTVPVVVCEGLEGEDALERSATLMKGQRRAFVTALAIVLALFTLPFYIFDLLFFSDGSKMGLGNVFFQFVGGVVPTLGLQVLAFHTYRCLQRGQEAGMVV